MEYIEKVKPFKDKGMLRYDNGDIFIARKADWDRCIPACELPTTEVAGF